MSPVAWQHVNMFGSFEFSDEDPDIDMDALAARYADSVFWSNATQPGQGDLLTEICLAFRGKLLVLPFRGDGHVMQGWMRLETLI
jgi:hypothetical protein